MALLVAVVLLPGGMITPAFLAFLVPLIGPPPLLDTGLPAALGAAIAVPAITVRANEEDRLATEALPPAENRFAMNVCHCVVAGGTRQRQWLRGKLGPVPFGLT